MLGASLLVASVSLNAAAPKITHKDAKKACLKENPNLKGKELKDCITKQMQ